MRARASAVVGESDGCGNTSSRYSMMHDESVTGSPSCTSVGTTPFGLIWRYSGVSCSSLAKLISRACIRYLSQRARGAPSDCRWNTGNGTAPTPLLILSSAMPCPDAEGAHAGETLASGGIPRRDGTPSQRAQQRLHVRGDRLRG